MNDEPEDQGGPPQLIRLSDLDLSDKGWYESSRRRQMSIDFNELNAITDKWGYIRQVYMERLPWILEAAKAHKQRWIDPYFFDWASYFSPIERIAWNSIRGHHCIPLYPQFPLFNYFIDFANPALRVGVELDGAKYHNPVKDQARDTMLARYGWRIFRIPGFECNTEYQLPSDLYDAGHTAEDDVWQREIENWLMNTCDGVIKCIETMYFRTPEGRADDELLEIVERSLRKHQLVEFDLLETWER